MTGGAVSGPVILGGTGPDLISGSRSEWPRWQRPLWPTAGSRPAGCGRACSSCRSTGCRPSSTACASRTSPTSTSGCRRAARVAVRERGRLGARSAGPTSSPSPATCSRTRAARRELDELLARARRLRRARQPRRRRRAIRSRAPATSSGLPATLLVDDSRTVELRGARVQIVGVDARGSARPFPTPSRREPACGSSSATIRGSAPTGYQLVLAGHMHAGQIVLPYPGGKLRLAHLASRLTEGVYRGARRDAARLARARHDLRPVPLLRPARGDRAGSKISVVVEGQSLISPDVLATYAADAAREVAGVRDLVGKGVKVARDEGRVGVELHLVLDWGANAGHGRRRGADARRRLPGADGGRASRDRRRRRGRVAQRVFGLTGATLERAPGVCQTCVWWQSRDGRAAADKERWMERAEDEWGAWGALYHDDDGRLLGSIQYGPVAALPARRRAARPALRATTPCSSPASTSSRARRRGSSSRSSSPRSARRATRARGRSRRSRTATRRASRPTSASSSTARSSRATSSPTSASRPCALQGRVELVAARARRPPAGGRGQAGEGAARRQGGVRAGAGAAAPVAIRACV